LKAIIKCKDYEEEKIYNSDDTGLSAKPLPVKTLLFKHKTQKLQGLGNQRIG